MTIKIPTRNEWNEARELRTAKEAADAEREAQAFDVEAGKMLLSFVELIAAGKDPWSTVRAYNTSSTGNIGAAKRARSLLMPEWIADVVAGTDEAGEPRYHVSIARPT